MKKNYNKEIVKSYLKKTKYETEMKNLQEDLFIIQYEKGEFVTVPLENEPLFQVVVEGTLNIYYIRDDGSIYSLANGQNNYMVGEMALFQTKLGNVYAEANDNLICIALSVEKNKEKLLTSCSFLQLICKSLTQKMEAITMLDAAPATLKQRVLTYMKYKCCNGELKGVEQAAFRLNCSSRQLQRILNQYEDEKVVIKIGKGTYRLNKNYFF